MATKDFRAERVRLSTIIGSGSHPGLMFYSGSGASNYSGGLTDPDLTAGVGNDVWFFVSGSKGNKRAEEDAHGAIDGGVVLFGGDVVVSGTFYVDKMVVEVEETTTGSFSVSGSLYVSQSAFINQGLTVNLARGDSDNDNFIVKSDSDEAGVNIFMVDSEKSRVGVGTSQSTILSGGADFMVVDQDNQATILLAREDTSISAGDQIGILAFGGTTNSGVNYSYNSAKIVVAARQTWDTSANNEAAEMRFYTQDTGDTANQQRMVISEHGRVGIGTDSPMAQLQVGDHGESEDYSIFINKDTLKSGSLAFLNEGVSAAAIVLDADEDLYIKNLGNNNDIIIQVEDQSHTPSTVEMMRFDADTSRIGIGFDPSTGTAITPSAKVEIKVDASEPSAGDGLKIDFNDTGARNALVVDSESTSEAAGLFKGKYAIEAKQDLADGYGLKVWRNIAEAGSEALAYIVDSNAANQNAALRVRQNGTGNILELADGVNTVVTVVDGGMVGIKHSTPEADLEIGTGTANSQIMMRAAGAASGSIAFAKAANGATGAALVYDRDETFGLVHSGSDKEIHLKQTDGSSNNHYLIGRDPSAGAQVLILSGGSSADIDVRLFKDTNFYISGSIGSRGSSTRGTSVFGGDVYVSGAFYSDDIHITDDLTIGDDLTVGGDLLVAEYIKHTGDTDTNIRFQDNSLKMTIGAIEVARASSSVFKINHANEALDFRVETENKGYALLVSGSTDQVLILSGGGESSYDEASGADVNFYVSGSVGARNSSTRAISVFGGDLHISGAITSDVTTFGQWEDGGDFIYPADNSGAEHVIIGGTALNNADIILYSSGAAIFNEQEGSVDFRVASSGRANMLFVDGTKNKVIMGGHSPGGAEHHTLTVKGDARFGNGTVGDNSTVLIRAWSNGSGSLAFAKGTSGATGAALVYDKDENIALVNSGSGDVTLKSGGGLNYFIGDVPTIGASQVLILSGTDSDSAAADPRGFTDCNFYVSGAIGQRGVHPKRGTAVFGGDLVVSGNLYADNSINGPVDGDLYINSDRDTHFRVDADGDGTHVWNFRNGSDTSVISFGEDGSGTFVGNIESVTGNLTIAGDATLNGAVTLGNATSDDLTFSGRAATDFIPKTDNAHNLGSETNRWANIYTGDLHLRNDKGNWTIQEDSDKLIVINNLTGKKYKMMLSPLEDEE